jgi:hypothetical protein
MGPKSRVGQVFQKNFTTLKAYRNLYRGHTQRFELSKCSKTHSVLPRIVIRNCFDLLFRFLLYVFKVVKLFLKHPVYDVKLNVTKFV